MKLPLFQSIGSARFSLALVLACLSFVVVGDTVALVTPDTTHTGVGSLVIVLRTGELYSSCSGTLIAPDVFLTAGHCTSDLQGALDRGAILDVFVSFDPEITQNASLVEVSRLISHPDFPVNPKNHGDYYHDIGVVLLAEPVVNRPITRLPTEGLLDLLQTRPETPVTSVGYGRDSNDHHGGLLSPHRSNVYTGLRASGNLSYRALTPDFIMVTQLANQGDDNGCFGDSGGPDYLIVDGQELLVGLNSLVNSYSCEEISWLCRLDTPSAREFLGQYVDLP